MASVRPYIPAASEMKNWEQTEDGVYVSDKLARDENGHLIFNVSYHESLELARTVAATRGSVFIPSYAEELGVLQRRKEAAAEAMHYSTWMRNRYQPVGSASEKFVRIFSETGRHDDIDFVPADSFIAGLGETGAPNKFSDKPSKRFSYAKLFSYGNGTHLLRPSGRNPDVTTAPDWFKYPDIGVRLVWHAEKKDTLERNTIEYVMYEVGRLMEHEDRKDVEFRLALATEELGDVAKYVTHDPLLNPDARPHGTKGDEVLAYGQAFAMLFACAQLRGIDAAEAVEAGLQNWRDRDWRKAEPKNESDKYLRGLSAYPGNVESVAFLDPECKRRSKFDGGVIVAKHATPDLVHYFSKANGIVTDEGGVVSHAANIARDHNIPCVVGTGNATQRIRDGQRVRVEAGKERDSGRVYLL